MNIWLFFVRLNDIFYKYDYIKEFRKKVVQTVEKLLEDTQVKKRLNKSDKLICKKFLKQWKKVL